MQFIENIKDYFGLHLLKNKLSKNKDRKVRFCNLNNAKKVGLLYNIDDERDSHKLLRFIKTLKEDFGIRNVKAISYFQDKNSPSFLEGNNSVQYFITSDLSWRREPKNDVCIEFMKQEFDLLIDLSNEFVIPLKSVLLDSKAKFKVGKYSKENEAYFDFMINSKHIDFYEFTQELVRYLTMINEK